MTAVKDRPRWTADRLRGMGATCDVATAAAVLGISRGGAYALVRRNEFPAKVLTLGRRRVVVVASLLEALGYSVEAP